MKTVRVLTINGHIYDGVRRKIGEAYEALASDVDALTAVGFVNACVDDKPKKSEYRRRDMRAEK